MTAEEAIKRLIDNYNRDIQAIDRLWSDSFVSLFERFEIKAKILESLVKEIEKRLEEGKE